jgi:tetratricopeptide (TPR) repeat protein
MAESASDHDAAIEACDELLAIDPPAMDQRDQAVAATKFGHLLAGKMDYDKAYAYGAEIVDGSMKDNPTALNEIAWTIVSPDGPKLERRDLKLALKAAQRAVDLTKNKDGMIMDTLAKVVHDQGNLTRALELQEKALKLIQASSQYKGTPFEKEISDRLDQYQNEAKNKGG